VKERGENKRGKIAGETPKEQRKEKMPKSKGTQQTGILCHGFGEGGLIDRHSQQKKRKEGVKGEKFRKSKGQGVRGTVEKVSAKVRPGGHRVCPSVGGGEVGNVCRQTGGGAGGEVGDEEKEGEWKRSVAWRVVRRSKGERKVGQKGAITGVCVFPP